MKLLMINRCPLCSLERRVIDKEINTGGIRLLGKFGVEVPDVSDILMTTHYACPDCSRMLQQKLGILESSVADLRERMK